LKIDGSLLKFKFNNEVFLKLKLIFSTFFPLSSIFSIILLNFDKISNDAVFKLIAKIILIKKKPFVCKIGSFKVSIIFILFIPCLINSQDIDKPTGPAPFIIII
jgi:hypothetical protein